MSKRSTERAAPRAVSAAPGGDPLKAAEALKAKFYAKRAEETARKQQRRIAAAREADEILRVVMAPGQNLEDVAPLVAKMRPSADAIVMLAVRLSQHIERARRQKKSEDGVKAAEKKYKDVDTDRARIRRALNAGVRTFKQLEEFDRALFSGGEARSKSLESAFSREKKKARGLS